MEHSGMLKTLQAVLINYGFRREIQSIFPLTEPAKREKKRFLYRVDLQGETKVVLRFSCEESFPRNIVEQQCEFSEMLRAQGIHVPKKFRSNNCFCTTTYGINDFNYVITAEEYVGEDLDAIEPKTFQWFGKLIGQIHAASVRNPVPIDFSTVSRSLENGGAKFKRILDQSKYNIEKSEWIIRAGRRHDQLADELRDMIPLLPKGSVHADLGLYNNLTIKGDRIYIIDFNLSGTEVYLFDMLISFYASIHKYSWRGRMTGMNEDDCLMDYLSGYLSAHRLSESERCCYPRAAALFDGLFFSKSIIEEHNHTGDSECLEKFENACRRFEAEGHVLPKLNGGRERI